MIDISKSDVSLQETIDKLNDGDILYLGNRIFNEKVSISKKNITLIGEKAIINYNAYHSQIIPNSLGGDGFQVFGTTGSATFTVLESASNFKCVGINFINSHQKIDGASNQAVAFKSSANNIQIENCSFYGKQDTLYIDLGKKNKVLNSYICGDVDFIFGSAECVFENCEIESIGNGYIVAPDTYVIHKKGFTFYNCVFKVKDDYNVYLGRPWYPPKALYTVYPRVLFKDCIFDSKIDLKFVKMHDLDSFKFELIILDSKYNEELISKNLTER